MRALVTNLLIGLVRTYQVAVSPLLGPGCRYHPSCSRFAIDAIDQLGPLEGAWRALCRVISCHPWGGSGYDPVSKRQHDGS